MFGHGKGHDDEEEEEGEDVYDGVILAHNLYTSLHICVVGRGMGSGNCVSCILYEFFI